MNKYNGVIFDLDGTLLNTLDDLTDSVNAAMRACGCAEHDSEAYKLKIGNGFRNLIEVSLSDEKRTPETIDRGLRVFLDAYHQGYMTKTAPYPGIVSLLQTLNHQNIKMGVNSNKRTDYTNHLVDKFFSNIPFVGVLGEREGVPKKPDPAAALELAHNMNVSPHEILYIGDSKTDILTGHNAGMKTMGVLWGFRGRGEFEAHGADYIVQTPDEILSLFQ